MLEYIGYSKVLDIVGGKKYGSTILANIIYNMDTFNVDVSNLRTIDNTGSDGATADGLMYGSNHIYLGATQSVPYPLGYTLGTELVTNGTFDTDVSGWAVSVGDGTLSWNAGRANLTSVAVTTTARQTMTTVVGKRYKFSITCYNISATKFSVRASVGFIITNSTAFGTEQTVYFTATGTSTYIDVYAYVGEVIEFDNVSLKELTYTTLGLIYYDVATKSHLSITTFTDVVQSMTTSHSNLATLNVVPTAGDLTALNANPEDIARMVNGVATVGTYSFGLADIEAFYAGNESLSGRNYIYDSIGGTASFPELITDPTLDTPASWSTAGATFNAGEVTLQVSGLSYIADITLGSANITNYHLVELDVISFSGANNYVLLGTAASTDRMYITKTGMNRAIIHSTNTTNWAQLISDDGSGITATYFSVKEVWGAPITNYTSTSRTTYLNTNYGASNFLYTQDAAGILTGIHTEGHIKSGTDGRNITIAMTIPYNHIVTKDIDKIEGSLTSCTITYSDTTTLVVP